MTTKQQKGNKSNINSFMLAAWGTFLLGVVSFLIGLWNAQIQLNEKGYYLTLLIFGIFSAISIQKTVRDKEEGIEVTNAYYSICWFAMFSAIALTAVGLWRAELLKSEKGFYAMSYVVSLFSVITVQKTFRDLKIEEKIKEEKIKE